MKRTAVIGALSLAALTAGGSLFFSATTGKESVPTDEPRIIAVKRTTIQTRVSETGTLEPARTLEIKSQVSGEVRRLHVEEGHRVEAGRPLVVIQQEPSEARQVAQIRATLEEQRVTLARAQRDLARLRSLLDKGYISEQDLEAADENVQHAKVRRDLAKRQLWLALGGNEQLYRQYLERDLSSDDLEEFVIMAPAAGTVLELNVEPGELITSGTATVGGGTVLMTLADLTRMVVQAKINEVNISRVAVGQPVEVRLDALPDTTFDGTVTAIAPQGEKEESIVTYEVRIEMQNEHQQLRPLMTANVDILTEVLPDVITLPLEALRVENGDDIVFVLTNGGRLARRVRVGLRTESHAVIAHGLEEGETVIIPSFNEKAG